MQMKQFTPDDDREEASHEDACSEIVIKRNADETLPPPDILIEREQTEKMNRSISRKASKRNRSRIPSSRNGVLVVMALAIVALNLWLVTYVMREFFSK